MSGTVGEWIDTVHEQFLDANLVYGHGTDNAWDEAVALVLQTGGWPDEQDSLQLKVDDPVADRISDLATRRIQERIPLAYLFERSQFMGYEFQIQPGVIVPRSPIGYLLDDGLQNWLTHPVQQIVDLCAGSGCLGIVAAHTWPAASVSLLELDSLACSVATANVLQHDLQDRVAVIQADVTEATVHLDRKADLIISNPPYVDRADMASLPEEYRAEPAMGLAAGEQGLDIMVAIIEQLPQLLSDDGLFVGEVGASAAALTARFPDLPFIWLDLPRGGEGVFILEARALSSHTPRG